MYKKRMNSSNEVQHWVYVIELFFDSDPIYLLIEDLQRRGIAFRSQVIGRYILLELEDIDLGMSIAGIMGVYMQR